MEYITERFASSHYEDKAPVPQSLAAASIRPESNHGGALHFIAGEQ